MEAWQVRGGVSGTWAWKDGRHAMDLSGYVAAKIYQQFSWVYIMSVQGHGKAE